MATRGGRLMRLVVVLEYDIPADSPDTGIEVVYPLHDALRTLGGRQPLTTRVAIAEAADRVVDVFKSNP